jgi:hypothetical protein
MHRDVMRSIPVCVKPRDIAGAVVLPPVPMLLVRFQRIEPAARSGRFGGRFEWALRLRRCARDSVYLLVDHE